MKKILLVLCIALFFLSCHLIDFLDTDNFNDYGTSLAIVLDNNSDKPVSEAEVFLTNDKTVRTSPLSLESSSQKNTTLDMDAAQTVDGSYSIKYKIDNTIHEEAFGYYTNGYPLEETINIIISSTGITIQ